MPKDAEKDRKDKDEEKTTKKVFPFPVLDGMNIKFGEITVWTGKNGKITRAKIKWPNDDYHWIFFDEDGKPTRGAGGGKGWETDWSIEYDKKGRKKSKTTTTTKGRVTTKTTEIFDPKTGKVIKEKTETWLEGPH